MSGLVIIVGEETRVGTIASKENFIVFLAFKLLSMNCMRCMIVFCACFLW